MGHSAAIRNADATTINAEPAEPAEQSGLFCELCVDRQSSGMSHRLSESSSSMMRLNASNGCAPLSIRPLMKNAGVPLTPASSPACASASTCALYLRASTHELNFDASRPSSTACCLRSLAPNCEGLANSLS